MAQKEAKAEWTANPAMAGPVELAQKQVAAIAETQKEIFDTLTKMNERWLDRATAEGKLVAELGSKLSSARSLPEATEVYQQWMTERVKTLAEDSRQFAADCQSLMQVATSLLPKGLPTASS